MGQQPSTAGKGRRKAKKLSPDAQAASALYDDDDDDYTQRSRNTPSGSPSPSPSPGDKPRKLSKGDSAKPANLTLTPNNNNTPSHSPKSTSPTNRTKGQPLSPKQQQQPPTPTGAAAAPFTPDSANPFLAPLDHIREEERPYQHLATISHFDVPTIRRLHTLFNGISASHTDDGIIDARELTAAMGLDTDCLLARAIFRIFDRTQTKRINFRTWVTTLSALSQKASVDDKIRFSFSLYDLNDDGAIDINELRTLLAAAVRENVLDVTETDVRQICDHTLRTVDRNGNGKVEYEEYRAVVMGSTRFVESFTLDVPQLLESFRWKRSEVVSEEEARTKANRFRGRDKQRQESEEEGRTKAEAVKGKGGKVRGVESEAAGDGSSKDARTGDSEARNDAAARSVSGLSDM